MLSNAEQISQAYEVATTAGLSPAQTLHGIVTALGFDFGDVAQVEHEVMQFYADPSNNPFIQAQLEARILVDAGHLEQLADVIRRTDDDGLVFLQTAVANVSSTIMMGQQDTSRFHTELCRLIVYALRFVIYRHGVNLFNASFGAEISGL